MAGTFQALVPRTPARRAHRGAEAAGRSDDADAGDQARTTHLSCRRSERSDFSAQGGRRRISAPGGDQDETILAFLYPGDVFGELAVVEDAPRGHVATAHEDVVLCAMGRDVLLRMIQETPALGYQITKMMGLRLRRFQTRIEELLFKSAHARIAHALLDMAADYGVKDSDGVLIPIRLNQRDLGNRDLRRFEGEWPSSARLSFGCRPIGVTAADRSGAFRRQAGRHQ